MAYFRPFLNPARDFDQSIADQVASQPEFQTLPGFAQDVTPNIPTIDGRPFVEDPEASAHRFTSRIDTTPDDDPDIVDPFAVAQTAPRAMPEELPGVDSSEGDVSQQKAANPFTVSGKDEERIRNAERRDRRSRIARGILGSIGMLAGVGGSLAGSPVGALGTGFTRSVGGIRTDRAQEERANQERRRQENIRAAAYEQQQRQQQLSNEQRAQESEYRRRAMESDIQLEQARAEQARMQTQRMQSEWDSLRGNQAASVNWLRNLASMYDPNSNELIRNIISGTEPNGVLTGASQDQLDAYARQLTTLAASGQVAGRARIGVGSGRGGGAPSGSPMAARALDTAPDLGELTPRERVIVNDAIARGSDVAGALDAFRSAPSATQANLYSAASGRSENREAGRFVLSEGLDQRTFNDVQEQLDRTVGAYRQFSSVSRSIERLVRQYGEAQVRAGLQGDPRLAQVMGSDIAQLRTAITRAVAEYRRAMTGSAASEQEDARIMSSLSMGSIANSPAATASSLLATGREMMQRSRDSVPPDYLSEWERRNREARDRMSRRSRSESR